MNVKITIKVIILITSVKTFLLTFSSTANPNATARVSTIDNVD